MSELLQYALSVWQLDFVSGRKLSFDDCLEQAMRVYSPGDIEVRERNMANSAVANSAFDIIRHHEEYQEICAKEPFTV